MVCWYKQMLILSAKVITLLTNWIFMNKATWSYIMWTWSKKLQNYRVPVVPQILKSLSFDQKYIGKQSLDWWNLDFFLFFLSFFFSFCGMWHNHSAEFRCFKSIEEFRSHNSNSHLKKTQKYLFKKILNFLYYGDDSISYWLFQTSGTQLSR